MSWFRLSPEDLTDDPIFLRLKAEPALLYTLLAMRSLRRGPLAPDRELYRMMWGSRFEDFDSAWSDVLAANPAGEDGLIHFTWADEARDDSDERSRDNRERKRLSRSRAQEKAMSHVGHSDVTVTAAAVTRPSRSTDGRTDEQTDGQDRAGDKPRLDPPPAPTPEVETWAKTFTEFPTLNLPICHAAYRRWLEYRRGSKLKAWPVATLKGSLGKFEPHGSAAWCSAIDESISNGWQGLFPPRNGRVTQTAGASSVRAVFTARQTMPPEEVPHEDL